MMDPSHYNKDNSVTHKHVDCSCQNVPCVKQKELLLDEYQHGSAISWVMLCLAMILRNSLFW